MKYSFVFFGTSDFAVPSLQKLLSSEYTCLGVITNPDKKVGRKQELKASAVKQEALKRSGLPIFTPSKLKEFYDEYKTLAPDFGVVVSYGKIIPQSFIDVPKFGIINVHASLLPRHRGAAPIQETILSGDKEAGVTIMKIDAGIDTGPVLSKKSVTLSQNETSEALFERLAPLGADLLLATLPGYISGKISPQPQPNDGATYAHMITKEDGKLDAADSAEFLERKVRAYNPWPGTFFQIQGVVYKVYAARIKTALKSTLKPGIISYENESLLLGTKDGTLELLEIQRQGKKRQKTPEFILGNKNIIGKVIE